MKKTYFYAMTLATLLAGSACEPIWDNVKVPEPVQIQFTELYPGVKHVEWEEEQGNFEAEFKISGHERTALFSADGKLLTYSEELEERYLPEPIRSLLQTQYGSFKVEEAYRVHENKTATYVVELEDNNQDVLLRFDNKGTLLQEQTTATAGTTSETASLIPVGSPGSAANSPLTEPEARWELPGNLREVSGIALLSDDLIACVQDEEGAIHLYDLGKKQVVQKIDFAGPGDYEGIAVAGKDAFILRSDGTLFEVADFRNSSPAVKEHKTVLAATQDAEGLAYDEENDRLLIACKGFDSKLGENKGIYAFTLADKKMESKPAITIPLTQEQLASAGKKKQKSKYDVLQPSSLEKHPTSGELYVLDAANSRLHTLDELGRIQKTTTLDKNLLSQPEGMTFGANGELYIASEGGKKGNGVIVKYPKGI
ncbi:SdiA-regulated domain-containing protein [Pontibacter ruber]|uniref:SdiA-regulated domain-containing protein n=1 Tax=Pontibacter ruber TaxID=1343895 RepID=A0ABW5CVP1_9BACT|nr:SdiA-regulated domain-containing protein [Pontibacter ruber]